MRTAILMTTLLAIAVPDREAPSTKKEDQAKSTQQQLLGDWQIVSAIIGGNPKMDVDGTLFTFTPSEIRIREKNPNRPNEDVTYALDEKKMPIRLDIMPKNGPQKRVEGILRIDGDKLTICFSHGGESNRPLDFTSPQGSSIMLMQLQRVKK